MIFGLLFLCKDAKKPLHFATRYGIFTLYHATQRWFLRPRQTEGKFRLAFAGNRTAPFCFGHRSGGRHEGGGRECSAK